MRRRHFPSRAIERATYDSVAFRFIAGNEHPDPRHDPAFRNRFLPQIQAFRRRAEAGPPRMGMLKLGTGGLDGTKVHANASRHSALSYGHAKKIEEAVEERSPTAAAPRRAADGINTPDGMSIPEELERRELRLAAILRRRRRSRNGPQSAWNASRLTIKANWPRAPSRKSGPAKKPRGRPPEPPTGGVKDEDQVNLTDEESRIMRSPVEALTSVTTLKPWSPRAVCSS